MDSFNVAFYQKLPAVLPASLESIRTDLITVDPRRTSLQWSTQLPGGFGQCQMGFAAAFVLDGEYRRTAWLERPVESQPLGHITVKDLSGTILYEGRRSKASYNAGKLVGVEAHGYGTDALADGVLLNPPPIITTSQGAMRYALQSVAQPPYLIGDIAQFVDPGIVRSLSEFVNQSPAQVMDQITKAGGSVNVLFDFTVYQNLLASLLPRSVPAQPNYQIPYDSVVSQSDDDSQLYSSLTLTYTDFYTGAAETYTYTDPTFLGRCGFTRAKQLPGGTITAIAAAQFAATWVQLHAYPWTSVSVTRPAGRGLEVYGGGAERPSAYVRAGEWVKIGEDGGPYIIVSTTYQAHADTLSLTLGQPAGGNGNDLDAMRMAVGHFTRGTNASTGAHA